MKIASSGIECRANKHANSDCRKADREDHPLEREAMGHDREKHIEAVEQRIADICTAHQERLQDAHAQKDAANSIEKLRRLIEQAAVGEFHTDLAQVLAPLPGDRGCDI